MAIAATAVDDVYVQNEPRRVFERVKITGTTGIAADTCTFTLHNVSKADFAEGGTVVIVSQTGPTVTLRSLVALGNDAVVVRIYGKIGSGMS